MSPLPAPRRAMNRLSVLIVLLLVVIGAGLGLCGIRSVRIAAARVQSQNNLKQIGIGIHNLASVFNGLEPPAVGVFPEKGPKLSLLFHLLPHIQCDNIYGRFSQDPASLTPEEGTFLVYCAPGDPTNPGKRTLLTSYASNAAIFGLTDGGSVRFPKAFETRGAANAILIMERYAVVGPDDTRHTWHSLGAGDNYLYPPVLEPPGPPTAIKAPEFRVKPRAASNDTAQGFMGASCNVLLGDGSARSIPWEMATAQLKDDPAVTVWAWACCLDEPYGQFPRPAEW